MEKMLDTVQSYAEMGKYKRVPVFRELYADAFTPVEVMRSLRAASRHCFLLESAEDKQKWGRYSSLLGEERGEINRNGEGTAENSEGI